MDKLKNKLLLQPSGLNSHFLGEGLAFDAYIQLMQDVIKKSRIDLTSQNALQIINANSPFSRTPKDQPVKNGVLLIHGLFDSPYYVHDLGEYFLDKNFLVQSILLPGHGTVPGDLLDIGYREWVKAVQYGVATLEQQVENIYLVGYSLGGLLSLHHALNNTKTNIKGIILFAPALQPKSQLKYYLAKYYKLFGWINQRAKWFEIQENINYTKYSCFPFNAGFQVCKLLNLVQHALKQRQIEVPLFITISTDDETISDKGIISFFLQQSNPKNKLLLYTNDNHSLKDKRILVKDSHFPQLKIINFSHTCLMISPENVLFGEASHFLDLQHYPNSHNIQKEDLYRGAASKGNLKNYRISRLSYNPDFKNLLENIDDFLSSIN
ncbi:MAG: alpha/beta fold hydrolase [Gammaproteobacteria bacterium]|nr:alpha/beta fold hydrolase [Gammaproteobacteria bacterium]